MLDGGSMFEFVLGPGTGGGNSRPVELLSELSGVEATEWDEEK